jgi:hypothetical protein
MLLNVNCKIPPLDSFMHNIYEGHLEAPPRPLNLSQCNIQDNMSAFALSVTECRLFRVLSLFTIDTHTHTHAHARTHIRITVTIINSICGFKLPSETP